jgi:hypothetical protein
MQFNPGKLFSSISKGNVQVNNLSFLSRIIADFLGIKNAAVSVKCFVDGNAIDSCCPPRV